MGSLERFSMRDSQSACLVFSICCRELPHCILVLNDPLSCAMSSERLQHEQKAGLLGMRVTQSHQRDRSFQEFVAHLKSCASRQPTTALVVPSKSQETKAQGGFDTGMWIPASCSWRLSTSLHSCHRDPSTMHDSVRRVGSLDMRRPASV